MGREFLFFRRKSSELSVPATDRLISRLMVALYSIILFLSVSIISCTKKTFVDAELANIDTKFFKNMKAAKAVKNHDSLDLILERDEFIFRIQRFENYNLLKSKFYIKDKLFSLKTMYRNHPPSPYFGFLTQKIECTQSIKIVKSKDRDFEHVFLPANSRGVYGVCGTENVKYRAIMAFLFCKKTKVFYQIELLVDKGKWAAKHENLVNNISCS